MPVGTTNPRVTAADPGAWLDGEPWTATLTFVNPGSVTPENPDGDPTDLTGSRLYIKFCAQSPAGLVAIQVCDSAAGDGSLVIPTGTDGQATFNAAPEARTWTAPRYGPGLLLLPALVFGDVYRQVGTSEPVCLTRLTLRVLPTTGAPVGSVGPAPKALTGRISAASALTGALTIVPPNALSGSVPGGSSLSGGLTIIPPVALSGGIAGAGSLTGALTKTASGMVALSGAIAGTGALTGALTVTAAGTTALSGAITGPGGPTGALTVAAAGTSPLTGSISGSGGPTGSLSVVPAQPLTGAVSGAGGPTGALTVTAPTGLVQTRKGRLAAAMAA